MASERYVWLPCALATVLIYGFWPDHPPWAYLIPTSLGLAGLLITVISKPSIPWIFITIGQAFFFAGDTYYYGLDSPFPHRLGNFLYLAAYVPWLAGLITMVARSGRIKLPEAAWFLILPLEALYFLGVVHVDPDGQYDLLLLLAFPVDSALLFIGACWLEIAYDMQARWVHWLVAALITLLVTDVTYRSIEAIGTYQMGSLLDLGWIAFYLMLPVAAALESKT